MTALRASTGVAWLAAYAVFGSALMMASAQAQHPDLAAVVIHFDLLAQPLDQALDAYEHIARQDVLIDGNLLGGRTSAPVTGDYSPPDALRRLLAGTGLQVNFIGSNAAVVIPSPEPAASSPSTPEGQAHAEPPAGIFGANIDGVGDHVAYAELVQSRLTDALCQSSQTWPGNYRMVVQLDIDVSGTVTNAKVAGPSDALRKAAVARIARSLVLGEGPPAGLKQPVTILLRPLGNGVVPDCPQSEGLS